MKTTVAALPGVLVLEPEVFGDARGFFMEVYRKDIFLKLGISCDFIQHNHSSSSRYVLRGLHYQLAQAQAKLVRVIKGEVFDVAVDLRKNSPDFGKWFGAILSEQNKKMLFVPEGFAHGFFVLSEIADFSYLCSDYYSPAAERGVALDCPQIAIDWPVPAGITPLISDKDKKLPGLAKISANDLPEMPEEK